MSRLRLKTTLLFAGLVAVSSVFAQSGSGGEFTIYNSTNNNIVVGFYTNDGDGWSDNWLSGDLNPGEQAAAAFFAETGACEQAFQVGWLGEGGEEVMDEPIAIDICEASNIYLEDNEIYFD